MKVPFYEGVPPARSVPQCGPPCPPGAQRFGLARSYRQEAAVFAETGLVGQCALSRSRPETEWMAGEGQQRCKNTDAVLMLRCRPFSTFWALYIFQQTKRHVDSHVACLSECLATCHAATFGNRETKRINVEPLKLKRSITFVLCTFL